VTAPALALENVERRFGGLVAVRDVTFEVGAGERVAVIGPNGAGKTTLFNVIAGEMPPSRGRVRLGGADVTRLSVHRRVARGLGRTYQVTNLFFGLTVLENAMLAAMGLRAARWMPLRPMRAYGRVADEARAALDAVGLGDLRAAPVRSLSYGDQRKLEIALALASRPSVLLLDEPTAGLAAADAAALVALVHALPRAISVLLIEHDMSVVFGVAQRVVVLHQGAVLTQGAPDTVRANPRVQEIYLGAR
jgi:branched-chain amino acid transport system ATP-binding protein